MNPAASDDDDDDSTRCRLSSKNFILTALAITCATTGASSFLLAKHLFTYQAPLCSGCEPTPFLQPCLLTVLTFITDFATAIFWLIEALLTKMFKNRREMLSGKLSTVSSSPGRESSRRTDHDLWVWTTPAIFSTIGRMLIYGALIHTRATSVQMILNMLVIDVTVVQFGVFRRDLTVHVWLGVIGTALAVVLAVTAATKEEDSDYVWMALVGSQLMCIHTIWEDMLYTRGFLSPVKTISIEGLSGLYISLAISPVIEEAGISDILGGFHQVRSSRAITIGAALFLFITFLFTASNLYITRFAPPFVKSCLFMTRTTLVWIAETFVLKWEKPNPWLIMSNVVFVLAFGTLTMIFPYHYCPPLNNFLSRPVQCFGGDQEEEEEDEDSSLDEELPQGPRKQAQPFPSIRPVPPIRSSSLEYSSAELTPPAEWSETFEGEHRQAVV